MVRIYNATDDEYLTIEEYIDAYDEDDDDTYYVQFLYKLATLFDLAKERTALRGRFAKDEGGGSLLGLYEMTADEEDVFDRHLEMGSGELFRKLNAWTKNVFKSYQYKALHDFEESYAYQGDVNVCQRVPGVSMQIQDLDASWTTDALAGMVFEVTSGAYKDQIANITSNFATSLVLDADVGGDITGETFNIVGSTSISESSLQFFITMPDTPYMDLFESAEIKLEEALILYTIKEWYRLNRLMQDYLVEEERYSKLAHDVKSLIMMKTEPTRRGNNLLGTTDY